MQEMLLNLYPQAETASLILKKFNAVERNHIHTYILKNNLPAMLKKTHETWKCSEAVNNLIALRQELAGKSLPSNLSQSYIKELHKKLFKKITENSGKYAQKNRSISKYKFSPGKEKEWMGTKKVLVAPPGEICQQAMKDMVNWYNTKSQQDPVLKAAELMLRFVQIHPFEDGNGRVGRCLFLIALMQSPNKALREIAPYLLIEYHLEKNKLEWGDRVQASGNFNVEQVYKLEAINQFAITAVQETINNLIEFLEFLYKKSSEFSSS